MSNTNTAQEKQQPSKIQNNLCSCGCGEPLELGDKEANNTIDGRLVRADCYYSAIGAGIEIHPIIRPRGHR